MNENPVGKKGGWETLVVNVACNNPISTLDRALAFV